MVALQRTKSGLWAARKVIPASLRASYGKREEKRTWPSTLTCGQAKAELAAWLAPIEERIEQLRHGTAAAPIPLAPRQAESLAVQWFRKKLAEDEPMVSLARNPDELDELAASTADEIADLRRELVEEAGGVEAARLAREVAGGAGYAPSLELRRLLQRARIARAEVFAARALADYGKRPSDPLFAAALDGQEAAAPSEPAAKAKAPPVSIKALFETLAGTGALAPHTVKKWRAAVNAFVDHLGHDNATAVQRSDVFNWLQSLVAGGLAVKTVKDTYRAAVARVFSIAHNQGQLRENPAQGVEVIGPKAAETRRKDISDAEAKVILKAALAPQPEGLSERHKLARRWVPWICAYTGARVAEVAQLRAGDIRQEDGVWVFHITPEAGAVKNRKARSVPIHSDLIHQGVLDLAKPGSTEPLFYDPGAARKPGAAVQSQAKQLGAKLAKWVRELGVVDVQSPNHGWRHRWKNQARRYGLDPEARDVIPGHAPKNEGGKYGDAGYPLAALAEEVEKLPAFKVD